MLNRLDKIGSHKLEVVSTPIFLIQPLVCTTSLMRVLPQTHLLTALFWIMVVEYATELGQDIVHHLEIQALLLFLRQQQVQNT